MSKFSEEGSSRPPLPARLALPRLPGGQISAQSVVPPGLREGHEQEYIRWDREKIREGQGDDEAERP